MKTIAVDIDGILTNETEGHDYKKRTPNLINIQFINYLSIKYKITLFSSRYLKDLKITEDWLKKYGVVYNKIVLGKEKYDFIMDDKIVEISTSASHYLNNFAFYKSCYLHKNNLVSDDEKHICYFCGGDIVQLTESCTECGIIVCPKCNRCICNLDEKHKFLLMRIRELFCNNHEFFKSDEVAKHNLVSFDELSFNMIKYSIKSVYHCRSLYKEKIK